VGSEAAILMDGRFFIVQVLMCKKQNQEEKLCGMSVRKFAVLTDDFHAKYRNGDQISRRKARFTRFGA